MDFHLHFGPPVSNKDLILLQLSLPYITSYFLHLLIQSPFPYLFSPIQQQSFICSRDKISDVNNLSKQKTMTQNKAVD